MDKSDNTNSMNIKKKSILIAEDDTFVIKFLEMALRPLNTNLVFADNGVDVVEKAKDPDFDLILMDIKLPLKDGLEATREIRKFRPDIPIIAQTAFALSGDEEKALNAGCNDYITKPINRTRLLEMIKTYLEK